MSSPELLVTRLRAAGCVFAEDEATLLLAEGWDPVEREERIRRRVAGEPLEHILGWVAFAGHRIQVDRGVFVPRRRTEILLRHSRFVALDGATVVELCCGAGAVAAVLGREFERLDLHAADIDPVAVACARRNVDGVVHRGDLEAALPPGLRGRIDLLVANAPYVPTAELGFMPTEARDHEPRTALDGGTDGLETARRLLVVAAQWLRPGGTFLLETSVRQAPTLLGLAVRAGLDARTDHDEDLAATALIACRPR